jgi:CMP-N,N'-diacetyllegionaminic acid synthase
MTFVGLIPARAGSIRLPGKNLALFEGKPLIAHACEAALASGVLDAIYVNTDCAKIAAVAARYGAPAPVLRPAALATASARTRDANAYLLNWLAERGEAYDAVVVLQPTSPLRSAQDIRAAVELYEAHAPCAVVSASPAGPTNCLGAVGCDGRFEPLGVAGPIYRLNGAIYIYGANDYLNDAEPRRTLTYPMPRERGVDIDTREDLIYAECLHQRACA